MKRVIIMSGVSGSGKSEVCEKLLDLTQGVKVSVDHFFMQPNGEYAFDVAHLREAHEDCFRRFIGFLQAGIMSTIVVDNTNCTKVEIAPYVLAAGAFGYDHEIMAIICQSDREVRECFARNIHGVKFETIQEQNRKQIKLINDNRLVLRSIPSGWNLCVIDIYGRK